MHRLQSRRVPNSDADDDRYIAHPFDLQRVMGRARNEALMGCIDGSGALNGEWSGYRLAAYAAYHLVSRHDDYATGPMPAVRPDGQGALGDLVLDDTNYLQVCAIDLADAIIQMTEQVDAVIAPAESVLPDVTDVANSLNFIRMRGADTHTNEMVPRLQRQLESLGATVEKGSTRRARARRAVSRTWRRTVTPRRAVVAALIAVVLAIALIGYLVLRPEAAVPPVTVPAEGGTTAGPVVRDVFERVDVTTPDERRSSATPWSVEPEPIILDPDNRDRSGVTVTVTLTVNPVRDRDVPVWLSFGRPAGLSYVPGETKMSNKNGRDQPLPPPEPPPGPVPPKPDELRTPLTLAGDGTPTVYTTKLILNELQGPQQVDIQPADPTQPSTASVLRCGLNALPFNVLLTGAESKGEWVNVTIPLYVLKTCAPD